MRFRTSPNRCRRWLRPISLAAGEHPFLERSETTQGTDVNGETDDRDGGSGLGPPGNERRRSHRRCFLFLLFKTAPSLVRERGLHGVEQFFRPPSSWGDRGGLHGELALSVRSTPPFKKGGVLLERVSDAGSGFRGGRGAAEHAKDALENSEPRPPATKDPYKGLAMFGFAH